MDGNLGSAEVVAMAYGQQDINVKGESVVCFSVLFDSVLSNLVVGICDPCTRACMIGCRPIGCQTLILRRNAAHVESLSPTVNIDVCIVAQTLDDNCDEQPK